MKERSALWDANIGNSYTLACEVTLLLNGARVVDPRDASSSLAPLNVVSGSVTLDRTAAQMGRLSLVVAEPWLAANSQLLTPLGYELRVRRGMTFADGTTEMMSLGIFPIQQATTGAYFDTTIAAVDRSQLVRDAKFENDYSIAEGTNYSEAIQALLLAGVPSLTFDFATTIHTTPLITFPVQSDRWDAALGMAKAIGCELFFNGEGVCVLRAEPSFSGVPDWTVTDGPGGVLVALAPTVDRANTYNRVIATGTNASLGFVPRGVWTDMSLQSRSNYDGGFGHKPMFLDSPLITTDVQATDAAVALGNSITGLASALTLDAVPNPSLEPGDMVLVVRDALNLSEVHILDSLTFGLGASDAMSGVTRALTPRVLGAPAATGNGNVVLAPRTVAGVGSASPRASGAVILAPRVVVGVGSMSNASGSGAIILGARTIAGTGTKT